MSTGIGIEVGTGMKRGTGIAMEIRVTIIMEVEKRMGTKIQNSMLGQDNVCRVG